ncbi:ABC transporter substrate-binding protein [Pimelobacter sp. 30-1]|uniref:ABC transporter substrate-binding protein n=1 Tax=Pimelobacter sp. 30-1 TaxID=2004991 RepID=UPI001C03C556|nr:ABC transporter substrate-binding protein [Pimelobacter sp. 30-1]
MFFTTTASRRRALATVASITALLTISACSNSDADAGKSKSGVDTSDIKVDTNAQGLLPADIKGAGKLTVAAALDYPPFDYVEDGKNKGFDIDLINTLAATLGLKVDLIRVPFDGQIAGLTANRFDVAMATFTVTPEREKEVDFVKFLTTGSVISVLGGTDLEKSISTTEDLCGHSVAVIAGSSSQALIPGLQKACETAGKPEIDEQAFQNQSSTVMAVINGRVDAKIDDATTSSYVSEQAGGKVVDVGEVFAPAPAGLAVGKDDPELKVALEAALQTLRDNGTYAELLDKWGQSKNAYNPEGAPAS